MRIVMALLCLIAALSGPLLRQAEAAGDFTRALVTILDPDGTLSTPDGGVGDDSGETVLKGSGAVDLASLEMLNWQHLGQASGVPRSFHLAPSLPDSYPSYHRQDPTTWLPAAANRRLAWLQLRLI